MNILVFTNSKLVKIAYENNNDVFLDATFQTVNKLYKQLLIIRIYSKRFNEFFKVCFILMTWKTKLLYKRGLNSFLSFLKEKSNINNNNLIFKFSNSNMELGLIKAVEEIMSKTKIKICYFHFSKL